MKEGFDTFELFVKLALFGLIGGISATLATNSWGPIITTVIGLVLLGRVFYLVQK